MTGHMIAMAVGIPERGDVAFLDRLRLSEKRAELAWLNARIKLLSAEIDAANAPPSPSEAAGDHWTAYRPGWKIAGRPHLSKEGEVAILGAFESGMRPAEVARLFRISERAALNWQHRWQSQKISD